MKLKSLAKIYREAWEEPPVSQAGGFERQSYRPPHIYTLFRDYGKKLKSMGINPEGVKLGQGTKGIEYDAGGGRVLKITVDNKEANSANILVGKKLKNVYNVEKVFQFDHTGYYGILQEKLKPVKDAVLIKFFDGHNTDWMDVVEGLVDGEISMHAAVKKVRKDAYDEYSGDKLKVNQIMDVVMQVFNGLDELYDNGIKYYDTHIGNIMKRGSNYVLVDIGYSKSTSTAPIEEI